MNKENQISIKLYREKARERRMKDGKEVVVDTLSNDGSPAFIRDDMTNLQRLLGKFDTTKKQPSEWLPWAEIRRSIYDAYVEGKEQLNLSIQQAAFLKSYLEDLPKQEGKDVKLLDGEVIVRASILEQLN